MVKAPQMTILSDHPSRAEENSPDLLALEGRLASVFDILRHKNTKCPVTVAIYGDWGTGKTSAMRWLETQLCEWNQLSPAERKGHPKVHPVWFDPWRYHDREDVWRGIIAEVVLSLFKVKAIKQENLGRNLRTAAKRFGAFLGRGFLTALAGIEVEMGAEGGKAKVSGEVFREIYEEWDRTTNPEKAFLNQFEDTLKSWLQDCLAADERLVLFIDDLDRSLPEVTLEVLEAIKLYLNLEPLMFVVGLDIRVVEAVVKQHYEAYGMSQAKGREYLRKLFQVEVHIPASHDQINGYSQELIRTLNHATGDYWRTNLGDVGIANRDTLDACILHLAEGNPREIKRLINSALVRGHDAASNRQLLGENGSTPALRFAQGVAFYLLQRFLSERGIPEKLFLVTQNLDWFTRASQWRIDSPDDDPAAFAALADAKKGAMGGISGISPEAKALIESSPSELQRTPFDQCLANPWFWKLLTIPFDANVGLQAPRLEPPNPSRISSALVDLEALPEEIRARLARAAGKTLATLTLGDLEGITELDLRGTQVSDVAMTYIAKLSALQSLDLDVTQVSDVAMAHIAKLSALQSLALSGTQVSDVAMAHIAKLSALQSLDLDVTQVSNAAMEHIVKLSALQSFALRGTQVSDVAMTYIAKLSALQSLDLRGTQVSAVAMAYIAKLSALQSLDLRGMQVSAVAMAHIAKLPALQSLYLSVTHVSAVAMAHIAKLPALKSLYLNGTHVSAVAMEHIAKLRALQSLGLNGTQVSDDAIKDIIELSALKWLDLRGTQVSDAGASRLQEALPNLHIYR
ncbi:MAG: P-loop NTPase fold protein [Chthoniobacteraceae bacterium]